MDRWYLVVSCWNPEHHKNCLEFLQKNGFNSHSYQESMVISVFGLANADKARRSLIDNNLYTSH